jgi:hypothetical protein
MARRKKHGKKAHSKKAMRGLRRGAKHIGRKGKKLSRKHSRKSKRG